MTVMDERLDPGNPDAFCRDEHGRLAAVLTFTPAIAMWRSS